MAERADYSVSFGRIARTILYEDALGQICLTFDVNNDDGRNVIYLEGTETAVEEARRKTVIDRVRSWLEAISYKVNIYS